METALVSIFFPTPKFSFYFQDVGYQYGKAHFARLLKAGVLPLFKTDMSASSRPFNSHPAYTFTDLAQMVCKVPRKNLLTDTSSSSTDYEEDDDDYQVGYASEPSSNILAVSPHLKESFFFISFHFFLSCLSIFLFSFFTLLIRMLRLGTSRTMLAFFHLLYKSSCFLHLTHRISR